MVMTGFGLGWVNIAADWSRYQRRDSSARPSWLEHLRRRGGPDDAGGLRPAARRVDEGFAEGVGGDPIGALASLLPTWLLLPSCGRGAALVSGAVLGIYSRGLTLLSLGIGIPRPAAAAIDGVIMTLATVYVVFFAEDFLGPVPELPDHPGGAPGGVGRDHVRRHRPASAPLRREALFDAAGRYGSFDWTALATLVVASLIGWGLVVNLFAADAGWNNWQGYLLEPLGLGRGWWLTGTWEGTALRQPGRVRSPGPGLPGHYVARRGTVRARRSGSARLTPLARWRA